MLRKYLSNILGFCLLSLIAGQTLSAQGESRPSSALEVTLEEAIRRATSVEGHRRVGMAEQAEELTRAQSRRVRAALLPHVSGNVSQRKQTVNLGALGLRAMGEFRPPELVGPFSTFDARLEVSQVLFNLSSIRRFQASKKGIEVQGFELEQVQDTVAAGTAIAYTKVLKLEQDVKTAVASVELAEELVDLAENQKAVGTGTQIEVTRARVQLYDERQKMLAAQNRLRSGLLELKRWMGVDLALEVRPSGTLQREALRPLSLDAQLGEAFEHRSDLRAAELERERLQLEHSADRAERYPRLAGFVDYGTIGSALHDNKPTWMAGVRLEIPLFEGGRISADQEAAFARLRQAQIRVDDLREEISLEVRLAFDRLRVAEGQVVVSEEGLELAREELDRARRRYVAGVTTSLEVTDAQTRLRRAEENYSSALFAFHSARVELADARGTLRERGLP